MEGDSKVIIQAIHRKISVGWRVITILDDANAQIQSFFNHKYGHIYREGNGVAELMVSTGIQMEGLRCWREENLFPLEIRNLIIREEYMGIDNHA